MKTTEIRDHFLKFFERHGHSIVPSSPLVPGNDPTLLFTNAGMVQFKDVFLGQEKRPYLRAVSSQRCVRAGGKHNDLENVGYTARHHTFFEMLGNFSFGDYFKREAIRFAWDFLTQDMKLPAERLWVTIYKDDEEAANIWLKEMKVDPKRFSRLGDSSNFWQMGDTGPCGPCSEIFYDHGPAVAGGPPGSPDEDGDRYIEIWNLVFMQYNRDVEGKLHPLPKPSVDTGMGLERIAAVMQGVHSNYEIDIFRNLINAVADVLGTKDRSNKSLNVIADHIRSCAFLIVDGVLPSNEGRGYVLRRIIRRAARHGHLLGAQESFFWRLVAPLVKEMGDAYPELAKARIQIERALRQEEERFAETLSTGLRILEDDVAKLGGKKIIPGDTVFRLYDTYGFPADLTNDIARERGLTLDMEGFEREMEKQRNRARSASKFDAGFHKMVELDHGTTFSGYERADDEGRVTELYKYDDDDKALPVDELKANESGILVLDQTPFYAESGGQVGDRGYIDAAEGRFGVRQTLKHPSGAYLHRGTVERGVVRIGDLVKAHIDDEERQKTRLNHSATHLLHAALRQVLGKHVTQKGSLVRPQDLRFDFSHPEPLTQDQIGEIERLVNDEIRVNDQVETRLMPVKQAMAAGAMALFGEKYGDEVRVVGMGGFSTELCGGTHVQRTGDIGLFKIVSEGGVAAGVRRIEAVTGEGALALMHETEERLAKIAGLVRGNRDDVVPKVEQLQARVKGLEKELEQTRARLASGQGGDLSAQAKDVKGVKVLAARVDGADSKTLRDTLDKLKDKLGNAAIVLAAVQDGKVLLIAGVTKDLTAKVPAGELVNQVAQRVGGKGGGRPDMAQAGGTDPTHLDAALADVSGWVEGRL
jgi:alanyl-tRNA synthetase